MPGHGPGGHGGGRPAGGPRHGGGRPAGGPRHGGGRPAGGPGHGPGRPIGGPRHGIGGHRRGPIAPPPPVHHPRGMGHRPPRRVHGGGCLTPTICLIIIVLAILIYLF